MVDGIKFTKADLKKIFSSAEPTTWQVALKRLLDTKKEENIFGITGNGNHQIEDTKDNNELQDGIEKIEQAVNQFIPGYGKDKSLDDYEIPYVFMKAAENAEKLANAAEKPEDKERFMNSAVDYRKAWEEFNTHIGQNRAGGIAKQKRP